MSSISDLNGERLSWQSSGFSSGCCHEYWQDAVHSTHGIHPPADSPSHRRSTRRQSPFKIHGMHRSIPRHDLRATDFRPESARHRNLSVGQSSEAVWHGLSCADQAFDAYRRQRGARLAHLGKFHSLVHPTRSRQSFDIELTIPCWTYVATPWPSFMSRTARPTKSTCWTWGPSRPGRSM